MDKVGRAVVYTTKPENQGKEYVFAIDITELFMLREVASSFIKIGDEPVGYNLKRKVCTVLYGDDIQQESRDVQVDNLLKDITIDLEVPLPNEVDTPSDL